MKVCQMLICIYILFLYVSITNLTKSDSGDYTSGLDTDLPLDYYLWNMTTDDDYWDYEHIVDFEFSGEFVPSASTPTPSAAGVPLYVCLTLVVIIIVSSAAVLIFCRKRASKAKDPPVEAEDVNVTVDNPVYLGLQE